MSMTIRSVVVFPAPLGPSRPKMLPRGIARERSLTARWPAKALVTPDNWMALSLKCVIIGPTMTQAAERGAGGGSGGAGAPPQLNRERGFTPREQDEVRGLLFVLALTWAKASSTIIAQ